MTDDAEKLELTRRALAHFNARTTDQADDVAEMPVSAYTDPDRYAAEIERIFKRLPLALALTLELPAPGDYKAMRVLDVPVLLIRGDDGVIRGFLNACRHRGAPIAEPGRGHASTLTCPYHAWRYGRDGRLAGRYGAATFGAVDSHERGLIALPTAERSGLVFVTLTRDTPMDIDGWLGDFANELDTLNLEDWHLYDQRSFPGAGWKVTMDGYLESYHHPFVHPETVGQHTVGNLLVLDTYGPHQRLTFGRKSLGTLNELDPDAWPAEAHIRLIHAGFPNLSISGILGDHCLVSQIFPGPDPTTSTTVQTVLAAKAPANDAERGVSQAFSDLTLRAVVDEDYVMTAKIQHNLTALADQTFLIGRNEPAVQNYHRSIARFMTEED